MMDKESAEALQETISELCSMIYEALKPVLDAANAMAKYFPEEPDEEKKEYPAPLTLDQIKKMDGCRVLIPVSYWYNGGLGIIDVKNNIIADVLSKCHKSWPLDDYGVDFFAYRLDYDDTEDDPIEE